MIGATIRIITEVQVVADSMAQLPQIEETLIARVKEGAIPTQRLHVSGRSVQVVRRAVWVTRKTRTHSPHHLGA